MSILEASGAEMVTGPIVPTPNPRDDHPDTRITPIGLRTQASSIGCVTFGNIFLQVRTHSLLSAKSSSRSSQVLVMQADRIETVKDTGTAETFDRVYAFRRGFLWRLIRAGAR